MCSYYEVPERARCADTVIFGRMSGDCAWKNCRVCSRFLEKKMLLLYTNLKAVIKWSGVFYEIYFIVI